MARWALALALLLAPPQANSADGRLTLSEDAINAIVERLGTFSDAGLYQPGFGPQLDALFGDCLFFGFLDCPIGSQRLPGARNLERIPLATCRRPGGRIVLVPGETRIPWQWWVQDARYEIGNGAMKFHAAVRALVGQRWQKLVVREAPVAVRFDPGESRLRFEIGEFVVPIRYASHGTPQFVTRVDVGALHTLSVAITPQDLAIPMSKGAPKHVIGRVAGAVALFSTDKLEVDFDVDFR